MELDLNLDEAQQALIERINNQFILHFRRAEVEMRGLEADMEVLSALVDKADHATTRRFSYEQAVERAATNAVDRARSLTGASL